MASPIPHKEYVEHWSVEQVSAWLQQVQLAECCEVFLRRGIDGHSLMQIKEESLLLWPDVSIRNRRRILKLISQINVQASPMAPKLKILPASNQRIPERNLCPGSDEESESSFSDEPAQDTEDDGFDSNEFDDPASPDCKPITNALESNQFLPPKNLVGNHCFGSSGATDGIRPPPRPPFPHPSSKAKSAMNHDVQPTRSDNNSEKKDEDEYLIPKTQSGSQSSGGMSSVHAMASMFEQVKIQASAEHEYEQVQPATQPPWRAVDLDKTRAPPELPPRNPPSEAIVRFRMPSSSRSSAPRSSDSVSSLSSTSISSSGDSSVSSSVMVPLANTTNRRPWIAQDNTHGSTFLRGSSLPVPKNTVPSMRPGYNPSLLGADKGNTRHVPPKASSSATAKYSNAFASPLPSVIPKPPSASLNSNGASDSAAEATGPENFRVKCSVSLGEGEKVLLEQVHIDLMNEPWFHMITRKKAEMCVKNCKDGTFLIRPSTRNTDPLTLCLRYQGRTYNIPIRQRVSDKCFALGREKANELAFETVPLLVEAYHEKPIRLQTGDKTLLKDTPPKIKENVYVKHTASSA